MSNSTSSPTAFASLDAHEPGGARFTPGTIIGDRYRIVALLGAGGMGEVYRADDLKLGQRVALKFVPPELAARRASFQALCAEVRIGRQISHPNVCRLYDIAEVGGQYFISMQYIDGEDLASLLRRVGRLPAEKALALARDVCAGLAAAHDYGIVHRDIKPANIMIDGRGRALIADFGLAVLAAETAREDATAGTPAYMAPEQIRGGEITRRTDIYSLGLVLYEAFTGKRVFTGATRADISDEHSAIKTRPSSIAHDVPAEVERLILRCIEEEPAARPASAHALLAALPGGDAMTAAIAAGDTPSPDMVAAARTTGQVTTVQGWLLFAAAVASILAGAFATSRVQITSMVPDIRSRDALTDRAREIAAILGVPKAASENVGFATNAGYLRWIASRPETTKTWNALATSPPSAVRFRYRCGPTPLVALDVSGRVTATDPAEVYPGMATMVLDHQGRLMRFQRVPPQLSTARAASFDWSKAFEEASLDASQLSVTQPLWTPPYAFDQQSAWSGTYPGRPEIPIRVEAASFRGTPVFFAVIEPWEKPAAAPSPRSVGSTVFLIFNFIVTVFMFIFARRNFVRGRGDPRGAIRIAIWAGGAAFLASMCSADHVADFGREFQLTMRLLLQAMANALFIYLVYLSIEPYVRRQWPRMLISWNRVASGRVRDALVGRDILIGAIVGGVTVILSTSVLPLAAVFGLRNVVPENPLSVLDSPLAPAAQLFDLQAIAILWALAWLLLVVLARVLTRSDRAALTVACVVLALVAVRGDAPLLRYSGSVAALILILFYVLRRHGVFAMGVTIFFRFAIRETPYASDFSAWYSLQSAFTIALLVAITAWAFYTSLGGRPLFGNALMEEQPAT